MLVPASTQCRCHSLRTQTLHTEGADSMRLKGQMRGNQECPSKGITNHGWAWRKGGQKQGLASESHLYCEGDDGRLVFLVGCRGGQVGNAHGQAGHRWQVEPQWVTDVLAAVLGQQVHGTVTVTQQHWLRLLAIINTRRHYDTVVLTSQCKTTLLSATVQKMHFYLIHHS